MLFGVIPINGTGWGFHEVTESLDRNTKRERYHCPVQRSYGTKLTKADPTRRFDGRAKTSTNQRVLRNSQLRIEARTQNPLFLRLFQVAHETILVFDLVEPEGRKVSRLPRLNFRRDQGQLVALPGLNKLAAEIPRCLDPGRVLIAGSCSDSHGIGNVGSRRRAPRGFVAFVVKEKMDKIRRALERDGRKTAKVHKKSAVTIDGDDFSVGQGKGKPG